MNNFDKIVYKYLTESVSDGILHRPLKSEELQQLNDGQDVVINITPDKHISKFTISPYDNKEEMESMTTLHSTTMDGDFTYDIIDIDWEVDNIKMTLRSESSDEDEYSDDHVNSQFEELVDDDYEDENNNEKEQY